MIGGNDIRERLARADAPALRERMTYLDDLARAARIDGEVVEAARLQRQAAQLRDWLRAVRA